MEGEEEIDQKSLEVLPNLPHELTIEILARLPVKSLLKFRCVSKSWLSLISSPHFIKTHLKKSSHNQDFTHHRFVARCGHPHYTLKHCSVQSLLQEPITHAVDIDFFVENTPTSVSVVGSCNGLICVVIDCKHIYLWNPSTRKSKKLVDSGFIRTQHCYNTVYGFGYDESTDDYNVLAIFRALNHVKIETKVYSLMNDSWRSIEDFPRYFPFYSWGKYVNGKLHWPGYSGKHGRCIVSFDLKQSKYGETELPASGDVGSYPVLGVLEMCLCVTYENFLRSNVDLWLMKEYGVKESWVKILSFPILGVRDPVPLCISRDGVVLVQIGSIFKLCNLQDESIVYPKIMNMSKCFDTTIYVESLVSLKAND